MRYLLDTQIFLWIIGEDRRLSKRAKQIFLENENELLLSMASVWEMAIKSGLGKLELNVPLKELLPKALRENSIWLFPIEFKHALGVEKLPFHHRDPFDRLIISQAISEKLPLISSDEKFVKYGVKVVF